MPTASLAVAALRARDRAAAVRMGSFIPAAALRTLLGAADMGAATPRDTSEIPHRAYLVRFLGAASEAVAAAVAGAVETRPASSSGRLSPEPMFLVRWCTHRREALAVRPVTVLSSRVLLDRGILMSQTMEVARTRFDLSGLSLYVGIPTNRDMNPRFVGALLDTQYTLMAKGIPCSIGMKVGNSRVERARTGVAWDFLESKCNRLLWLDDDQTFAPKDVIRLLCLSTELEIVGAVYPCKREPIELRISTTHKSIPSDRWGLIRVDGMGLGFTMVTRQVMQALADHSPLVKFDEYAERRPMVFHPRLNDKMEDVGEDIGFFHDCKALGFEVWVDPAMSIGHIGTKVYEGTLLEMSRTKDVEVGPLAESA